MRKVRITTGLSCLMAFILCFVIFGSNLAMSYDTVVNGMLGVQTSKVINDESVEDEDTIYYKSAYGDINAKTLKVLKEDTYTEAVQEQEEGTVLLYNKDNALPLSKDEQISLPFNCKTFLILLDKFIKTFHIFFIWSNRCSFFSCKYFV